MTDKQVRIITACMALTGGILATGDKLTALPGLPGWLTSSWPLIFAAAGIFDRIAHILIAPSPQATVPTLNPPATK